MFMDAWAHEIPHSSWHMKSADILQLEGKFAIVGLGNTRCEVIQRWGILNMATI